MKCTVSGGYSTDWQSHQLDLNQCKRLAIARVDNPAADVSCSLLCKTTYRCDNQAKGNCRYDMAKTHIVNAVETRLPFLPTRLPLPRKDRRRCGTGSEFLVSTGTSSARQPRETSEQSMRR